MVTRCTSWAYVAAVLLLTVVSTATATAKYSGGTGEPNDPYQIATAGDLIALGETPEDYDKHFILTADIDLDPNLPGRKVFDKAVIAPASPTSEYPYMEGVPFGGALDGNGHTLSHLTIAGGNDLGLFGYLVGEVKNLGVVEARIAGSGDYIGGLVGWNWGGVTRCYTAGAVSGGRHVGGLVGENDGSVIQCYSTGAVTGTGDSVGGLVGYGWGLVTDCYTAGTVRGSDAVGGLVGCNAFYWTGYAGSVGTASQRYGASELTPCLGGPVTYFGSVSQCYSASAVSGPGWGVGGLVGRNEGFVTQCYSNGPVSGTAEAVGGLVGDGWGDAVTASFWDTQTSGRTESTGGEGKTTGEMHDPNTFMAAGWDLVGLSDGPRDIWGGPEGGRYPILWWQIPGALGLPTFSGGAGEPDDPFVISTADELNSIGDNPRLMRCYFQLASDIDLASVDFYMIGDLEYPYTCVFEGNSHTISNLTIRGESSLGLIGRLASGGEVRNLGVVDVNITGSGTDVGGLVGFNEGTVIQCYSTGVIAGGGWRACVGGLVGRTSGHLIRCYNSGTVQGVATLGELPLLGSWGVGGLAGSNSGTVSECYSTGAVSGTEECWSIGGLVGDNVGVVTQCYSTATVTAGGQSSSVGGLVGFNNASVIQCYSTGKVSGTSSVGGLVGGASGVAFNSVWDMETSGLSGSAGGIGLTTAGMMDPYVLGLNGFADDANWVLDAGRGYPRLAWQKTSGEIIPEPNVDWLEGYGTAEDPYRLSTANQLTALARASALWDEHFVLTADIDLDPGLPDRPVFAQAPIQIFTGIFDGNGHTVCRLTIKGRSYLGLFGTLEQGAEVKNLGIVDVNIAGSGAVVGGLVGNNWGVVANCCSSGAVSGSGWGVGGLAGYNKGLVNSCYSSAAISGAGCDGGLVGENDSEGRITDCHSTGVVTGTGDSVGGLVGRNNGDVMTDCYSTSAVSGRREVGGLVGDNGGSLTHCWSTSAVSGDSLVGGLAGTNYATVTQCYSTSMVRGTGDRVGGLLGENCGTVTACYSTGAVSGRREVGGLVGGNIGLGGTVTACYSTGAVNGIEYVSGLAAGWTRGVTRCFWDTQTSGQATGDGGTGKTTAEMQTASTFVDAGWDFVGETVNGPNDVWKMAEGLDYPRLWWEPYDGQVTLELGQVFAVTLESNPTTGYRWEWVDSQDSILDQIGEAQFKGRETGDPPLVGAGGWEIFNFKAASPGPTTLKLVYRRPWEEGVEPLKTFLLHVVVP